jgi:exosortase
VVLFAPTVTALARDWWTNPDAGHGLLLAPLALWLCWRKGLVQDAVPTRSLGLAMIVVAVLFRVAGAVAAELFTQRSAMLLAAMGLVVFFLGVRQLVFWWLPVGLLALSIPLPALILNQLALPLQLLASRMGAWLLELRNIPVHLAGNVILLPGHQLFVTEACSGLRSLTSLLSLGLLFGGVFLGSPWLRGLLMLSAIALAIVMNAVRVFLTGFLVFFVSPEAGDGFLHLSQGWLMFVVSIGALGLLTWVARRVERRPGAGGTQAVAA